MGVIRLNPNKQWTLNYNDDYAGNLLQLIGAKLYSRNLIDTLRGDIGFGSKLYKNTDQRDISGMTSARSIVISDADGSSSKYWATDNVKIYRTTDLTAHFAADVYTNSPIPAGNDVIVFGRISNHDRLLCATATNIKMLNNSTSWDNSWWVTTLSQSALTSAPHRMAILQQPFLLGITDGNLFHTIDQNLNVSNSRVIIPTNQQLIWVRTSSKYFYLGVKDLSGKGVPGVYKYDPVNETVVFFPINYIGSLPGAGWVDSDDIIRVFGPDGRIYVETGSGLAIESETLFSKLYGIPPLTTAVIIHPNGIVLQDNKVKFLISGQTVGQPGGIYVYDRSDKNFYLETPMTIDTSDPYQYLTGNPGALFFDGTNYVAGTEDYNQTASGIYVDANNFNGYDAQTRIHIITPKIQASNQDILLFFRKLWVFYEMFGTDSICTKYRTTEISPAQNGYNPVSSQLVGGGGTMTSTTSFTTTFNMSGAVVGDEVHFISGINSGFTAHITAISLAAGTYTVTLDEAVAAASGTVNFFSLPYKKIGIITSITKQSIDQSIKLATGTEWIQFKIEIRGKISKIRDLLLQTETNIQALNPKETGI